MRMVHRRVVAMGLAFTILLSGCEVVSQEQNAQAPTIAPVAPPVGPPTAQIAGLDDREIGSGGVAQAQNQPTSTIIPGDQQLVSDYERVVNNVYERSIRGLVNLTDGSTTGSGFVIDRQGYIITNDHVAGNMNPIIVTFFNRVAVPGELVGTFPDGDIAVVKVAQLPQGVEPVQLGDSATLRVGQIAVAMGSPLGLEQTVTAGIVSALNRSISDISRQFDPASRDSSLQGLIQTDASINPGNSGGPLFDSQGRVIGMNTLIATRSSSSETAGSIGLGFAVPVNRIKRVARQIIETGRYRRPLMGVTIQAITPEVAQQLNLPATSGVMVAEVSGQQAQQAGLRGATRFANLRTANGDIQYPLDGDIITAINNTPVIRLGDLRNILETQADPGTTVTITFLRAGREQTTRLTLGASQ